MTGVRAGQRGARARLVLIGQEDRPPEPGDGWVPEAPAADGDDPAPHRGGALTSALRTYSATYGHPLEHPTVDTEPITRRWATSRRVVVAALVVLALLCAAVLVRGAARMPSTTVDVALPTPGASAGPGGGAAGGPSGPEPGAPGDLGVGAPGVAGPPDRPGNGPPGPGVTTVPPDGAVTGQTASEAVVVHVVGQVVTPGVVTLPVGSRVVDALAAAGGPTADADLSVVNLARVVVDGEQVLVPRPGQPPPPPPPAPPGGVPGSTPAVVDLNTADVTTLDTLPGIGPVLAQRILDWRTDHGRFTSVEELGEVQGIGPALLAGLRDVVRV